MSLIFIILAPMFKRFSASVLIFSAVISVLVSCQKPDDEVFGCAYGKSANSPSEFKLGCMSRAEFNRYIQNPNGSIQGIPIVRDFRFVKVDDCVECK
jgi:hypothetical protein